MGNVSTTRRKSGSNRELEKYCKPTGLYETCPWEERVVRRWIMDGQVAPRYPGVDAPCYAPSVAIGAGTGTAANLEAALVSGGAGRGGHGPGVGVGGTAGQQQQQQHHHQQQQQQQLLVPQQLPLQQQTEECPICFMHYQGVNTTVCCSKPLCTECYLQVRPPRSSVVCPFCNCAKFHVAYRGPPSKEDGEKRMAEEQRTIEARIHAEQEELMRQAKERNARVNEVNPSAGSSTLTGAGTSGIGGGAGGGGARGIGGTEGGPSTPSSAARSDPDYMFPSTYGPSSRASGRVSLATVAERRLTEERIRNQIVHLPSATPSLGATPSSASDGTGSASFNHTFPRHYQALRPRTTRGPHRLPPSTEGEDDTSGEFQVDGLRAPSELGEMQQVEDLMLMEALRLSVLDMQAMRERSGDILRRQVAEVTTVSSESVSAAGSASGGSLGPEATSASGQVNSVPITSDPGSLSSRLTSPYLERAVARVPGENTSFSPLATPGAGLVLGSGSGSGAASGTIERSRLLANDLPSISGVPSLLEASELPRISEDLPATAAPADNTAEDAIGTGMDSSEQASASSAPGTAMEASDDAISAAGTSTITPIEGARRESDSGMESSIEALLSQGSDGLSLGGAMGSDSGVPSSSESLSLATVGATSSDTGAGDGGSAAEYLSELPESEEEQLKLAIALSLRSGGREMEHGEAASAAPVAASAENPGAFEAVDTVAALKGPSGLVQSPPNALASRFTPREDEGSRRFEEVSSRHDLAGAPADVAAPTEASGAAQKSPGRPRAVRANASLGEMSEYGILQRFDEVSSHHLAGLPPDAGPPPGISDLLQGKPSPPRRANACAGIPPCLDEVTSHHLAGLPPDVGPPPGISGLEAKPSTPRRAYACAGIPPCLDEVTSHHLAGLPPDVGPPPGISGLEGKPSTPRRANACAGIPPRFGEFNPYHLAGLPPDAGPPPGISGLLQGKPSTPRRANACAGIPPRFGEFSSYHLAGLPPDVGPPPGISGLEGKPSTPRRANACAGIPPRLTEITSHHLAGLPPDAGLPPGISGLEAKPRTPRRGYACGGIPSPFEEYCSYLAGLPPDARPPPGISGLLQGKPSPPRRANACAGIPSRFDDVSSYHLAGLPPGVGPSTETDPNYTSSSSRALMVLREYIKESRSRREGATGGDSEETKVSSSVVDPAPATTTPAADTLMPGSATAAIALDGSTRDMTADFMSTAAEPPPVAPRDDTVEFPGGAEEGPNAAQLPGGAPLVERQDYAHFPYSGSSILGSEPSEADRIATTSPPDDKVFEEMIMSHIQAAMSRPGEFERFRVQDMTSTDLNETEDRPVITDPVNIPQALGTGGEPSGPGEDGSQTRSQSSGHEEPLVSELLDYTFPTVPEVQPDEPETGASMSHEAGASVDLSGKWILCTGVGNATEPSQDSPTATSRGEEGDAVAEEGAREVSPGEGHVVEGSEEADTVEGVPDNQDQAS